MKIGIIGGGTVGRATARAFVEHVDEVRVWDTLKERCTHYSEGRGQVLEADLVFVCLPTPQKQDSLECDISVVEEFFKSIIPTDRLTANFVLRSTVPIGTTKRLSKLYSIPNLVHSPEFLTARCAVTDAHTPSRNIIGSPAVAVNNPGDSCRYKLWDLYTTRFPGVPCYLMPSDESEAVKLFVNGFFATKIAYFNEVRTLADKLGLDWGRVMEGVLSDGRIAHSHMQVPGPDGKRGFGGACLVKDLNSLVYQFISNDLEAFVTVGSGLRNEKDREGADDGVAVHADVASLPSQEGPRRGARDGRGVSKGPRKLDHLIKSIKTVIPPEEVGAHQGLDHLLTSVAFALPEQMNGLWGRLMDVLWENLGEGAGAPWKKRVGRIVRDEEAMPNV